MPTKSRTDNRTATHRGSAAEATPSIIAAGVVIEGDITAAGEIHLDGRIIGNVKCTGLTMGEESEVTGTVQADSAVIRGRISGQLAADNVRLEKSAELEGDVYHKTLAVEAGAKITGRFIHGDKVDLSGEASANDDNPAADPVPVEDVKAAE